MTTGYLKTTLLLAALTGLFIVAGYLIGGEAGMVLALVFAGAGNLFAYWNADKIVLRMYGAREVDRNSAPDLVRLVEQLADISWSGVGSEGKHKGVECHSWLRIGAVWKVGATSSPPEKK